VIISAPPARAQKTDPYHLESGGFGSLLRHNTNMTIWWCEGAYKIMRDTPLPSQTGDTIRLWSAKNEYEPFQLIIRTEAGGGEYDISAGDLVSADNIISKGNIGIRKLEYVEVTKPTDSYAYAGYWPDPLPPLTGPFKVPPGKNTTLWITVYIPPGTSAGSYTGKLTVNRQGLNEDIPLKLTVWDFDLPAVPGIRSGFGLSVDKIAAYHNLTRESDIKQTFDLYMQYFKKYKIAPYDPFYLYPIREKMTGLEWEGGIFDFNNSYNGNYSLMIKDEEPAASLQARYKRKIPVKADTRYNLRWNIKSGENDQQYCILLEGYNKEGEKLIFENRMEVFSSDSSWGTQTFSLLPFNERVSYISLSVFPAFRTADGEKTGTVWIDNIMLNEKGSSENMLMQSGFEVDPGDVDIELDFSDFDIAGERYLDEFGFNAFRLYLKGMGSGTYYSRNEGVFEGFKKGSPVYDSLMDKYLQLIQDHLAAKGWLGREYIYWFDEPAQRDYPFVREGMETIKKSAPGLNTFITENDPGPEIMDVTDISCTIFHRVEPEKVRQVRSSGQGYWSYLCTAPKAPWISAFIDHDAINLRMWLWISYDYDLSGILIWSSNYWTSRSASPAGWLQNPWTEPASFVQGYGWPYGKQTLWGNGDGRLFYPPNKNPNTDKKSYIEPPVPSIRLEFLRQGIEDYEYLVLLEKLASESAVKGSPHTREARELLKIRGKLFTDGRTYTKDPADILEYRKKIAHMILKLKKTL